MTKEKAGENEATENESLILPPLERCGKALNSSLLFSSLGFIFHLISFQFLSSI